jgi:hypothetical protein
MIRSAILSDTAAAACESKYLYFAKEIGFPDDRITQCPVSANHHCKVGVNAKTTYKVERLLMLMLMPMLD